MVSVERSPSSSPMPARAFEMNLQQLLKMRWRCSWSKAWAQARWHAVLLVLGASVLGGWATTNQYGEIDFTVPNGFELKRGPDSASFLYNRSDTTVPVHYQQVFSASAFKEFPPGGAFIFDIADRAFCDNVKDFIASNVVLRLSTTQLGPDQLSKVFAQNPGFDEIVVANHPTLRINGEGSRCPLISAADSYFGLETPFFYNPAKGNLLLDLRVSSESRNATFPQTPRARDAVSLTGDSVSSVYALSLTKTEAEVVDTTGLIFQFRSVGLPELRASHQTNTVMILWGYVLAGFKLQWSESAAVPGSWVDYPGTIDTIYGQGYGVFLPDKNLDRKRFFRLFWNTPQPGVPSPKVRVRHPR